MQTGGDQVVSVELVQRRTRRTHRHPAATTPQHHPAIGRGERVRRALEKASPGNEVGRQCPSLSERISRDMTVTQSQNEESNVEQLVVTRPTDRGEHRALHGLTRALLANMIEGVTNGYKKSLEIQGVGYKAEMKGKNLVLSVGYANQIVKSIPGNVTVQVEGGLKIHIVGADKQAVGEFAAQIRSVRKPEPYKGKGIRYEGEVVKIKPGMYIHIFT